MKKVLRTFMFITTITVMGGTLYAITKRLNKRSRLEKISDEGYETARDILFPAIHDKHNKLHYGPVLPQG